MMVLWHDLILIILILKMNGLIWKTEKVCTLPIYLWKEKKGLKESQKAPMPFSPRALKSASVKRTNCSHEMRTARRKHQGTSALCASPALHHPSLSGPSPQSLNLERQSVTGKTHRAHCGTMASCPSPSHLCSILLSEPWQGRGRVITPVSFMSPCLPVPR